MNIYKHIWSALSLVILISVINLPSLQAQKTITIHNDTYSQIDVVLKTRKAIYYDKQKETVPPKELGPKGTPGVETIEFYGELVELVITDPISDIDKIFTGNVLKWSDVYIYRSEEPGKKSGLYIKAGPFWPMRYYGVEKSGK